MDKPRFVRAIETALSVRFVETKSRNGGVAWSNKDLALGHLIDHLVKKTYHVDTPKSSCNTLTRSEPTTGDWYIVNIQGNDKVGKVVITPATPAFEIGAKTRLKATSAAVSVDGLDKCKPSAVLKVFKSVGNKFDAYFGGEVKEKNALIFPKDGEDIWRGHLEVILPDQKRTTKESLGKLYLGYSSTTRSGNAGTFTSITELKKLLPIAEQRMGFVDGDIDRDNLYKAVEALLKELAKLPKTEVQANKINASALDDVSKVYKGLTADELKEGVKLNPGQLNTLLQIFKSTGYRQSGTGANMTATSPDGEALQLTIKGDELTVKLKE